MFHIHNVQRKTMYFVVYQKQICSFYYMNSNGCGAPQLVYTLKSSNIQDGQNKAYMSVYL